MKYFLSIVLLCFLGITSNAQTTFRKQFMRASYEPKVLMTHDHGFLLAASSLNTDSVGVNHGSYQLIRTDSSGDTLWTKFIGQRTSSLGSVFETSDHGFVLTGYLDDSISHIISYTIIFKVDSNGEILWAKKIDIQNPILNQALITDCIQTSDSGLVLLYTYNDTPNYLKLDLIKLNSIGTLLWSKRIGTTTGKYIKGSALAEGPNGNIFITGYFYGNSNGSWVIKTDPNGTPFSGKQFLSNDLERALHISIFPDNEYTISGIEFNFPNNKIFQIRIDASDSIKWSKFYMSPLQVDVYIGQTESDQESSTFIFEYGYHYDMLVKTDSSGTVMWSRSFSSFVASTFSILSLKQAADGGYIMTTMEDVFGLIKTDDMGNTSCNDSTVLIADYTLNIIQTDITNQLTDPVVTRTMSDIFLTDTSFTMPVNNICLSTSVNEINEDDNTTIYPNPCAGWLSFFPQESFDVILFNSLGQTIAAYKNAPGIDVSIFKEGIYVLKMQNKNKRLYRRVIVGGR